MNTASYIAALLFLLLFSAFFSATETAFSALNKVRIKSLAAKGDKKAAKVIKLTDKYDRLISTILVGNNIVNILSSSLATVMFVFYLGNMGVTVSTIVTTLLVLTFGEITPKTLAKEYPERFAMFAAPAINVFMVILTPVNAFFSTLQRGVIKLFKSGPDDVISEQELLTYVEEVREDGTISAQEEDLIRSIIEFDDVYAVEICTPRVDVHAVSVDESDEEISRMFHETGFSRLPVYRDTIDDIIGILIEKDFYHYTQKLNEAVIDIIRPAVYITKSMKISKLLSILQQKKTHMAVIVDEYGGTIGIVTIEDILEELVGEIYDEHDEVPETIIQNPDGSFKVFGGTEIDIFFELLGFEEDGDNITVGGWILEKLGHIPLEGESFDFESHKITIDKMEDNRILTLTVTSSPAEDPAEDS